MVVRGRRSWRCSILQIFVSRTKTGKSMRAVAEDQEIASLMGIDVDRIVVTTFVIGGILAGIAGVLFALTFEQVNFFMGVRPGIAAFTAAVLGGIGSIGGAALGGFLLGLLQSVGPALLLTGIGVPVAVPAEGRGDVRRPGPGADLPSGRAPGRRRSGEGLMPVGRLVRTGVVGGHRRRLRRPGRPPGEGRRDQPDRHAGDGRARGARVRAVPGGYIAVRPRVVAGEIVTATTSSAATSGAVAGLGGRGLGRDRARCSRTGTAWIGSARSSSRSTRRCWRSCRSARAWRSGP